MRFRAISIKGYRQYRDLALNFTPGDHDLQVIVAGNGVGKTNLLNAFTWCLYGKEPHLGFKSKEANEPKLNKEIIADCVAAGNRTARVEVVLELEDGSKTFRIHRALPVLVDKNGACIEKNADQKFSIVEIDPNGRAQVPYGGERAKDCLDRLLPESIREYFFFDGEQLGTYFRDTGGDRIKEAVYSISQIDLLLRMIDHLKKVLSSKRREASKSSPNTEKIEKDLQAAEQTIEGCKKFISEKEEEIARLESRLSDIEEVLRNTEDVRDIERRRVDLDKKRSELQNRREEAYRDYYRFVRDQAVDFYLYDAAQQSLDAIRELEKDGQLPPLIDKVQLENALRENRCLVCGHELDDDDRARISDLLTKYQVGSETSNILSSMRNELARVVENVKAYPRKRAQQMRVIDSADKALQEASDELGAIEEKALRYADTAEGIKKQFEDREEYQRQIVELGRQIGTRQSNAGRLEPQAASLRKQLSRALEQNKSTQQIQEMVSFGNTAQEVLEKAKKSIADEVRCRMERRTEELFKGLVWKDSKCDRIELSENYNLSLYDRSGFSCAGTCSAAERSLLALSFTLAMHEVSGFDSPLFIDTPTGRVSGENRENFAKTLVGVSESKQLILAFTPDEYTESISNEFEPVLATYIKLELDEGEGHVKKEVEVRG